MDRDHCDLCNVKLSEKNIFGGGFHPPDCPACYKIMCKDCARITSGEDVRCKDCFAETSDFEGESDDDT